MYVITSAGFTLSLQLPVHLIRGGEAKCKSPLYPELFINRDSVGERYMYRTRGEAVVLERLEVFQL